MRGKEGDFFSSCKPFQLCGGLRAQTGSERKKERKRAKLGSPTKRERKKERKEKERRGTGIAWHFVSFSVRSQEEEREDGKEKGEREGSVSWDCLLLKRREGAACKAKLGLELGGLSGSLPSGYSPTTHCSALLACLLAWLVQDPAPSPPLFYLPPDALFHSSLSPSKILPAFDLLYHLSPGAVDDLRMRGGDQDKRKELKH